jgi:hypothetical protein
MAEGNETAPIIYFKSVALSRKPGDWRNCNLGDVPNKIGGMHVFRL